MTCPRQGFASLRGRRVALFSPQRLGMHHLAYLGR